MSTKTLLEANQLGLNILKAQIFQIASIISAYPNEDFAYELNVLLNETNIKLNTDLFGNSFKEIISILEKLIINTEDINNLRSDYIDIFDRAKTTNSLYETEYGKNRTMFKTTELADLAGFYKAFGLNSESDDVTHEMADHVSVELEFYSFLLLKQAFLEEILDLEGLDVVFDARKKFLNDHLGKFTYGISQRPGVLENDFYKIVFQWIHEIVSLECEFLEINPTNSDWVYGQTESEEMNCMSHDCSLNKLNEKK